ncbi:MAG: hypothetical protein A3H52_02395 [Candidatus Zambryskibacteria bacterium RIFCSPLOWO2_02_FULL_39_26]|uniref:Uncharacterized protein n=1 Tax=Candidatus Zambryskibacteria bacterium RIFCSPLOWO2_12_FULL_39_23 TaxID=1802776 RepID=A0A1G2UTC8_9BACT|nr:MAG: hypothetical protein A2W51_01330 [Candidatus Zambryskibacteria bacterium RIFCSPHIGHO2_02_39_10]OHA99690.1 MAG: hypothetical protein A3E59_01245 [Candidatus Zambryskibacteria bacterium RIFCSPHIGHO2_12_FULL_39_47]OHB09486.1 MAG: hypothetical protein A3H52_02395 [Candidatus Zambryskibacteria bacterium RIFCSPLOWO2_02_FULL_39_26]OHB12552.1 MAG: hypothetical protein A3G99_01900 [Candidatus Zambryskibacteria bacterium RIFCSPLOWO2_12_FULL_39_23]
MTKQNLEKALKRELILLNEIIDQKIVRGFSYAREARRHKYILSSIRRMRQNSGWFSRSFSFIT